MLAHHSLELVAVEHIDYFAVIGHLHGRSTGIAVARHNGYSFAFGGYDEFFSELAGAQQQYFLHVLMI